jgi:hypothetical protein
MRLVLSQWGLPFTGTLVLLVARLVPAPPLTDPVSGAIPPGVYLHTPLLYLILAPLFTLWDGVSMLSLSRLRGFLIGLAVLYLLWAVYRPTRSLTSFGMRIAVSIGVLAVFLILGATWHRPMLSLAGTGPANLVVDFHSHTNRSHDVRKTWMHGFDAEANRRWHRRAGFDVAFVTDHNVVSRESGVGSRGEAGVTIVCPGIEVSAWRAHIVLLGDTLPVDQNRYNGSLDSLLNLLRTSDTAYGSLSVASLPEYRRNHWGRLPQLVDAGLDGFEIVNAAPKANEMTRAQRDSVVALARARNRFVVGVSDSHGWGATSMVWNLVRVTPAGARGEPCSATLRALGRGFPAVQVIERHRLRPDDWWPNWLTPVGVVWETWRSMGWPLTVSWLGWIWLWPWGWRVASEIHLRTDSAGSKIG